MKRLPWLLLLVPLLALGAAPVEQFEHGRFGNVRLLRPDGTPRGVALFLSGDAGWTEGVNRMAQSLVKKGLLVAALDTPHYLTALRAKHGGCNYLAADFEDLSHRVEREAAMDDYRVPTLLGYASGASVAYAALAQSPPGTFTGAVALGFCPEARFGSTPLCPGAGGALHYRVGDQGQFQLVPASQMKDPLILLRGEREAACRPVSAERWLEAIPSASLVRLPQVDHAFADVARWQPQLTTAVEQLMARAARAVGAEALPAVVSTAAAAHGSEAAIDVSDLPLTELPVQTPVTTLALMISGDGGWAGLDKEVGSQLAARGIPVVGVSSLKYFWKERTPEETAADMARVLRRYLAEWGATQILLVGYSFGADVMPFIINRLPPDLRARVHSAHLLAIGNKASFEVHVAGWLGSRPDDARPIRPELDRIAGLRMQCFHGEGDEESAAGCAMVSAPLRTTVAIGEGHHFGYLYAEIADHIADFAAR